MRISSRKTVLLDRTIYWFYRDETNYFKWVSISLNQQNIKKIQFKITVDSTVLRLNSDLITYNCARFIS